MERKSQSVSIGNPKSKSILPFDLETILPTPSFPDLGENEEPLLQFLNYPPVKLTNFFYANLLNHYRSIEIYISLIPRPNWGTPDPRRFQCAIDLCRTHAALGKERNFLTTGKIWGLHLSGLAFGGPELYPVYFFLGEKADVREKVNGLLIGWRRSEVIIPLRR
jgi:hypothetical protein